MDIDISDILADVSRPTPSSSISQQRTSTTHTHTTSTPDISSAYTDHQQLVRSWTNERCSPDLLPYPTALMSRTMERIRIQISKIEDLASGISPDTGMNGHSHGYTSGGASSRGNQTVQNLNLTLAILQTDLSRTQFIIRSLLRQRLAKISKHAGYYLSLTSSAGGSDTKRNLLSDSEAKFLRSHQALLAELYSGSFLNAFPPALRRLDDSSGGVNMVEPPGAGDGGAGTEGSRSAVVVRCLAENGWSNDADQDVLDAGGVELRMRRGEVWVVRWSDIRNGVIEGDLEVL